MERTPIEVVGHWLQNPLPAIGDSGLIFVTAENVDIILKATEGAQ